MVWIPESYEPTKSKGFWDSGKGTGVEKRLKFSQRMRRCLQYLLGIFFFAETSIIFYLFPMQRMPHAADIFLM